jgi:hypothetical protein
MNIRIDNVQVSFASMVFDEGRLIACCSRADNRLTIRKTMELRIKIRTVTRLDQINQPCEIVCQALNNNTHARHYLLQHLQGKKDQSLK